MGFGNIPESVFRIGVYCNNGVSCFTYINYKTAFIMCHYLSKYKLTNKQLTKHALSLVVTLIYKCH